MSEGHDTWDASGIIIVKVLILMNHPQIYALCCLYVMQQVYNSLNGQNTCFEEGETVNNAHIWWTAALWFWACLGSRRESISFCKRKKGGLLLSHTAFHYWWNTGYLPVSQHTLHRRILKKKKKEKKLAHTFTENPMSFEVFNCVEEKRSMVSRRGVISAEVSKEGQFVGKGPNLVLASKGKWAAHHPSNY